MMMQQQRYCFLALAAFSSIVLTTIVGIGSTTVSAEEILAAANDNPAAHDVNESNQDVDDKNIAYDGSDLIEWITSNGGFIHPNTRIGLDPTGNYRGVFVKSVGGEDGGTEEGIEEDELVCSIPW